MAFATVPFLVGYFATALVIGAYVPQIWRRWSEQCSAGISVRAYALRMLSSALFLLGVILVLARRFRN
ncbi:PQ-loop repeat-containing protein [Bradyrhizobium japonicum]|uniref:PQ-loop repeat-containing protein n=1 Tax=Bradyrhizobium TaxID=374 RepID=UPI00057CD2F5|nr:PQ-loop repeat-containing protein [Bradyrhizobium japonicum]MBR0749594.1 PQ-loop repeat-containing protein [Bradyrhizobium japonicum]